MDEIADYFGDVPAAADGDSEEDAANDLTFGEEETADIVPGDKTGAAWKSGHEELAARIEREKEEILRRGAGPAADARRAPAAPPSGDAAAFQKQHVVQSGAQQPLRVGHAGAPLGQPTVGMGDVRGDPAMSQYAAAQQHHQPPLQMNGQVYPHPAQLQQAQLRGAPQNQPHPQFHPPAQGQHQPPPGLAHAAYVHLQQLHQAQQQDHQRYAMLQNAYADHMRRFALHNQQYAQQNPGAAPPAQVHEQQRRTIETLQQQIQHQHQQMMSRQAAIAQVTAQMQRASLDQQRLQQHQMSQAGQTPAGQHHPHSMGAQPRGNGSQHFGVAHGVNQGVVPSPSVGPGGAPKAQAPGGRLAEIERQMQAAGLGPAAPVRKPLPTVEDVERRMIQNAHQASKGVRPDSMANHVAARGVGSRRRLENMTDKDLEIVLKMHLRQLEMSETYKDEFYVYALREKVASGGSDTFDRLAEMVVSAEHKTSRISNGKRSGPKGARPRVAVDEDVVDLAKARGPESMSTLASALGTLQVWNPKAPRKLIDFGSANSEKKTVERKDQEGPLTEAFPKQLLREDERVVVRSAVENGYDLISAIHDVARRKAPGNLGHLVNLLFDVFRLPLQKDGGSKKEDDDFLIRMCGFSKGRRFVGRALTLLKPPQQVSICCCIMRNLHVLTASRTPVDEGSTRSMWDVMSTYLQASTTGHSVAFQLLSEFERTHKANAEHVTSALASSQGATVIASCLGSVLATLRTDTARGGAKANDAAVVAKVCDIVITSLGGVFEQALDPALVWHVAALMDAVAPPDRQAQLRGLLKTLLDEGRAPNPPQS